MQIIDRSAIPNLEKVGLHCLKIVDCADMCPTILPVDDYQLCRPSFFEAIRIELVDVCAGEFYLACAKFGKIVGPICPFDPVRETRFHRLTSRIEELQAKVERLMAK